MSTFIWHLFSFFFCLPDFPFSGPVQLQPGWAWNIRLTLSKYLIRQLQTGSAIRGPAAIAKPPHGEGASPAASRLASVSGIYGVWITEPQGAGFLFFIFGLTGGEGFCRYETPDSCAIH